MDLIASYFPDPATLDQTTRQAARARAVAWLAQAHPELDLRPNSVAGDNIATPIADFLAGLEESIRRFRSDINPGNVANGVVYNCDVVKEFLGNFGVTSQAYLPARGLLRLTFSTQDPVEIDRNVQFTFSANQVFTPQMFSDRGVLSLSSTLNAGGDSYALRAVSGGWETVIPVEGVSGDSAPTEGTQPSINTSIPNLVRVEAAYDFFSGDTAPTVVEQAARLRATLTSPTLDTRLGTASALLRRFTEFAAVSVVSSGDDCYLLEPGQVGIHTRARQPYVELHEIIALPYSEATDRFYGTWTPKVAPLRLLSIGTADYTFDADSQDVTILAQATGKYPLFMAGFSGNEQFALGVPMPRDAASKSLISITPMDNAMYGIFEVIYWADNGSNLTHRFLSDRLNRPVIPTYVRPLIPYLCSQVEVSFIRQPGVVVQLQQAVISLTNYLHSLGGTNRYSLSKVGAIMRNAGAFEVSSVRITARALFSAADAHVPAGVSLAVESVALAAGILPLDEALIGTESYEDTLAAVQAETFCAIGPENRGLLLLPDAIVFREVRA
jgi:hypothetical protein